MVFARQGADGISNLLCSLSRGSWKMPIAQSRSNFTTLPFMPQAAVAALQLLPKATRGTFIKLHVNAYIWGSCRNVLLLSLRVLFNPSPCPEMHRGTSAAPLLCSVTSPARAVPVLPSLRGRVLGLRYVWVCPLGPPGPCWALSLHQALGWPVCWGKSCSEHPCSYFTLLT